MSHFPDSFTFIWDKGNREKNLEKHKVTVSEAEEIFQNDPFIISEDMKHSHKERRFQGLGKTNMQRLLFAAFTMRNDQIRVISVRDMNRKEEVVYEKSETNS